MATKAELEAELARLKQQLHENARAAEAAEETETQETADVAEPDPVTHADWEKEISEVLEHLEEFPAKQPLLLALGAFAVGYLIGRSK